MSWFRKKGKYWYFVEKGDGKEVQHYIGDDQSVINKLCPKLFCATFMGETFVAGNDKHRWECPVCVEKKNPERRFNLSPNKDNQKHKCRFCKTVLNLLPNKTKNK